MKSEYSEDIPNIERIVRRVTQSLEKTPHKLDLSQLSITRMTNVFDNKRVYDLLQSYEIREIDLSFNKISRIKGLEYFKHLKKIRLNNNKITQISGLSDIESLEIIDLDHNLIKSTSGLQNANKLVSVSLNTNSIKNISHLEGIPNLKTLHVANNQISRITGLDNLISLEILDIGLNRISEISGIEKLTNLKELSLYGNALESISGLEELQELEELYLEDNQIKVISGLEKLANLQFLQLNDNNISTISGIENLTSIKSINLANNQIESIDKNIAKSLDDLLSNLPHLESLVLDGNPILQEQRSFKQEDYQQKSGNVNIFRRDLENMIKEDVEPDSTPVPSQIPRKVVLIGNSSSGKSTLLDYLKSAEVIDTDADRKSTELLNILKWDHGDPDVFFYDLGGQDYYHASYNLFLSRDATYILVWDQSKNRNMINDSDEQRPEDYYSFDVNYWLGNIAYKIGAKNPSDISEYDILLVETKIDLEESLEPEDKYSLVFDSEADRSNISESFRISVSKHADSSIDEARRNFFRTYFLDAVDKEVEEYKYLEEASQDYIQFWEENNKKKQVYKWVDLFNLLQQQYATWEAVDEVDGKRLFRRFHHAGMLLWYEELPGLNDKIFIHPKKVQDDILALLKELEQMNEQANGCFSASEAFFRKKKFTTYKPLMLHHELLFLDETGEEGESHYIVPRLLPTADDNDALFGMAKMGQYFAFSVLFSHFMPMGIFNRLICLFGHGRESKAYYRYQMIFTYESDVKVWVKCDMQQLKLEFRITETSKSFDIMRHLFQAVMLAYYGDDKSEWINQKPGNMSSSNESETNSTNQTRGKLHSYLEQVPNDTYISIDSKYYLKHADLRDAITDNRIKVSASRLEDIIPNRIDLSSNYNNSTTNQAMNRKDFFRYEFSAFADDVQQVPKKVFVSYAHEDNGFKTELESFLINLEREGKIEIWQDGLLKAGDNWDEKINTNLVKADIIIFLVSQSLIASNYVHEVELKKTLTRINNDGCTIIPVLIKQCDWLNWQVYPNEVSESLTSDHALNAETGKISNFQFIPFYRDNTSNYLKPVNQFEHREEAWMEVVKQIRKVV